MGKFKIFFYSSPCCFYTYHVSFLFLNRNDDVYIILEDLTQNYEKPCILDLKMGTRMYGDFAKPEKIASQRRKSQQSTSSRYALKIFFYVNKQLLVLRAGSGQSPTRNLARGPCFLSGPTQPGPHF